MNERVGGRRGAGAPRPPRGRLSRSAEFERVYRHGRSTANRHLIMYAFPSEEGPPRLGMSVSRKVGGAVERNHLKRLLREAFAAREERLAAAYDIVVVARPPARELAEREGLEGVAAALDDVLERGAVLASGERAEGAG